MTISQPFRNPELGSPELMTRRAWWLVVLNFVIPGSAQLMAGNRRLGRAGLIATASLWVLVAVGAVVYRLDSSLIIGAASSPAVLGVLQVSAISFAVLWVVLTLDTLRLVKIVRVLPSRRVWIAGFSVVLLVGTVGTVSYATRLAGVQQELIGSMFSNGVMREPVDGRYNILILGGDAGPDRTGLRPDSISVLSVDTVSATASLIGLPRNMMNAPFGADSPLHAQFPDGYNCRDCLLNSLYTHATLVSPGLYPDAAGQASSEGIEATRDAVQGILGIDVQYYVLIDMAGFEQLIDALGGIVVPVEQRLPIGGFEDENGQPIGEIGWIEPGTQRMDGFTASWYARARHGTSDYDRMIRQRNVQQAILDQFEPINVLSKFDAIARAGGQVVSTDIPQELLGTFISLAGEIKGQQMKRLELVPPDYDVTDPDFADIHSDVAAFLTRAD